MASTTKKENTKIQNESSGIIAFINAISAKNYALAHKYLTGVVNDKLKARIDKAASNPLF